MGQTEKQICGTTHIGARRPLCTHGHALRRGNGRGVPSGITRRLAAFFPPSEVHSPCAPRPHFHRQRLSLRFAGVTPLPQRFQKRLWLLYHRRAGMSRGILAKPKIFFFRLPPAWGADKREGRPGGLPFVPFTYSARKNSGLRPWPSSPRRTWASMAGMSPSRVPRRER